MTEYSNEFLIKPNKVEQIEQKRFQVINKSMQMKSVSKVQLGQLYNTKFLSCGWKTTKELIKNGSWK